MLKFKGKENCDTVIQRKIHKLYSEKTILPFPKFCKPCVWWGRNQYYHFGFCRILYIHSLVKKSLSFLIFSAKWYFNNNILSIYMLLVTMSVCWCAFYRALKTVCQYLFINKCSFTALETVSNSITIIRMQDIPLPVINSRHRISLFLLRS